MTLLAQDPKIQETFNRFAAEIRNKTFAEAYFAVKDLINQKDYCKRVKINESRFSRVLTKLENETASKS